MKEMNDTSRHFFFVYSFWSGELSGKGNLNISVNGFPSYQYIKAKAIGQLMDFYENRKEGYNIVIENWKELSKEDYDIWAGVKPNNP